VRVIVTGSRHWADKQRVYDALNEAYRTYGPYVLVHGKCATGADAIAHEWYSLASRLVPVTEDPFAAAWEARGPAAGPERNERMVEAGGQLMLAFVEPCSKANCDKPKPHDSHGTAGCMELAREAGIEVREFRHA
jgi:hypothetical protein